MIPPYLHLPEKKLDTSIAVSAVVAEELGFACSFLVSQKRKRAVCWWYEKNSVDGNTYPTSEHQRRPWGRELVCILA